MLCVSFVITFVVQYKNPNMFPIPNRDGLIKSKKLKQVKITAMYPSWISEKYKRICGDDGLSESDCIVCYSQFVDIDYNKIDQLTIDIVQI